MTPSLTQLPRTHCSRQTWQIWTTIPSTTLNTHVHLFSFNHTHLYPITLFKQTLGIQSVQSNAQRAQPDLPSIFVINCYPGFCVLFFLLHCTVCQSPEPLPVFFFFFLTLNLSHVLDLSMLNCLYCIRGDSVGQEAGMHPYWDARQ